MLFYTIREAITVVILPQTEENLQKTNTNNECRSFVDSSYVNHLCVIVLKILSGQIYVRLSGATLRLT